MPKSRTKPSHAFRVELGSTDLDIDGVWPDGDAPENPTAEDVAAVMRRDGGLYGVLTSWDLITEIEITDQHGGSAVVT